MNGQIAHVVITVDVVLTRASERGPQVLLIKRRKPPFANMWALPGGKLDATDASLEQAAEREVREETGVSLTITPHMQVRAFGDVGRDPRGRIVSVAYLASLSGCHVTLRAGDDASDARWFPTTDLPPLALDHEKIVRAALSRLPTQVSTDALQSIEPCQCEIGIDCGDEAARCQNTAYWRFMGRAVCMDDIKTMAGTNNIAAEALLPALLAQ